MQNNIKYFVTGLQGRRKRGAGGLEPPPPIISICTRQSKTLRLVKCEPNLDLLKKMKQDACTGVHSACRREENEHNLDICVLRRLRLRQGQMQGFLGLKVGGGGVLICKYGI